MARVTASAPMQRATATGGLYPGFLRLWPVVSSGLRLWRLCAWVSAASAVIPFTVGPAIRVASRCAIGSENFTPSLLRRTRLRLDGYPYYFAGIGPLVVDRAVVRVGEAWRARAMSATSAPSPGQFPIPRHLSPLTRPRRGIRLIGTGPSPPSPPRRSRLRSRDRRRARRRPRRRAGREGPRSLSRDRGGAKLASSPAT